MFTGRMLRDSSVLERMVWVPGCIERQKGNTAWPRLLYRNGRSASGVLAIPDHMYRSVERVDSCTGRNCPHHEVQIMEISSFDKFTRRCHVICIAVGTGRFRKRVGVERAIGYDGGATANREAGRTEQVGLRKARGGCVKRVCGNRCRGRRGASQRSFDQPGSTFFRGPNRS